MNFTDTQPLVFTKADEPFGADDWLLYYQAKVQFGAMHEVQKPLFTT